MGVGAELGLQGYQFEPKLSKMPSNNSCKEFIVNMLIFTSLPTLAWPQAAEDKGTHERRPRSEALDK